MSPRRWRRFVRGQRSPVVRRWLRLDQAYREIGALYRSRDGVRAVASATEDVDGISISGHYVLDGLLAGLREGDKVIAR